jgi:hypothetical protein
VSLPVRIATMPEKSLCFSFRLLFASVIHDTRTHTRHHTTHAHMHTHATRTTHAHTTHTGISMRRIAIGQKRLRGRARTGEPGPADLELLCAEGVAQLLVLLDVHRVAVERLLLHHERNVQLLQHPAPTAHDTRHTRHMPHATHTRHDTHVCHVSKVVGGQ